MSVTPFVVCQGFQPEFNKPISATLWLVSEEIVADDDAKLTATKTAAASKVAALMHTEAEMLFVVAYEEGVPVIVQAAPREYGTQVPEIPTPVEPPPPGPPTDDPPGDG